MFRNSSPQRYASTSVGISPARLRLQYTPMSFSGKDHTITALQCLTVCFALFCLLNRRLIHASIHSPEIWSNSIFGIDGDRFNMALQCDHVLNDLHRCILQPETLILHHLFLVICRQDRAYLLIDTDISRISFVFTLCLLNQSLTLRICIPASQIPLSHTLKISL